MRVSRAHLLSPPKVASHICRARVRLVELGLRVVDLAVSLKFYQEVVGLDLVRAFPGYAFLKSGDLGSPLGRGGHPQFIVLAGALLQRP